MKLRIISLLVLTYFMNTYTFAQSSLNAYKYVTVPKKFDFQKTEDQYQLNSLTKFLFDKEGFKTLFDLEIKPQEVINSACLNLRLNVSNNSNMLTTKLKLELLNCKNEVVYSGDGRSKLKVYKKAYHEALRKAFEPLKNLNYKYNPELILDVSTKEEEIKEEPSKIEEEIPTKVEVAIDESVEVVEGEEKVEAVEVNVEKPFQVETIHKIDSHNSDILYAQKTPSGYQLVDNSPKVVYVLQKTSVVDLFILKDKNGIVYKKDEKWLIEYYVNNELVLREINIKF